MTENQIIILCFIGFWMFVSILTYILLLRCTKKEYKKFYPHPIVNIVKDLNSDSRFKFWEKLFIFTFLNIVYLPIICEWFITWCLYKSWKFIYVDNTQKQKSTKDITEMGRVDGDYEAKVEKYSREMEEALNNPEAMPKMDNNDQLMSEEFLQCIKDNSKKNEKENN